MEKNLPRPKSFRPSGNIDKKDSEKKTSRTPLFAQCCFLHIKLIGCGLAAQRTDGKKVGLTKGWTDTSYEGLTFI